MLSFSNQFKRRSDGFILLYFKCGRLRKVFKELDKVPKRSARISKESEVLVAQKHLFQLTFSTTMDLVAMPEDRLIMSIRAQQTDPQPELPCFSALFSKASVQEQNGHMCFLINQLKVAFTKRQKNINTKSKSLFVFDSF